MGKLTSMHKSVTMDLIRLNFVESEKKGNVIIVECIISTKVWMVLLGKCKQERSFSGFMIEGSNNISVVYGKKRRGGK